MEDPGPLALEAVGSAGLKLIIPLVLLNQQRQGVTQNSFAKLAEDAKCGCLMSRLLDSTVTMDARLVA